MTRLPLFCLVIAVILLETADLMQSGRWCSRCQDVAEDKCKAGTCQEVKDDTWVDHEAFHHMPAVDFGGGD